MSAHLSYADAELLLRLAGRGKPIDTPDLPELYRLAREGYCKMDPCEVYRLTTPRRIEALFVYSARVDAVGRLPKWVMRELNLDPSDFEAPSEVSP